MSRVRVRGLRLGARVNQHGLRAPKPNLLVDGELLGDLGAGLAREDVLELDVQLVLLLEVGMGRGRG